MGEIPISMGDIALYDNGLRRSKMADILSLKKGGHFLLLQCPVPHVEVSFF